MKPYYQDDAVTLYHGDCREIVPQLGKFDLLLTDPPYGMDYQSARRTEHQRKDKIYGDKELPIWAFEWRGDIASFFFCRWNNLPQIPTPDSFIVWDKMRHGMGDLEHEYGRQWEAIAFYAGENHSFTKRPVDIIRVACVPACDLIHPNEKPIEIITPLILAHPSKTILDPFSGSGCVGRAAKDLGRKCTMIEMNEAYCEIAARRMQQEVFKL